jgi:arylsulfatase A-like enzyme
MPGVRNILFIMCDQLRWDYLSCAGHPTLETPNIDGLARRGVRFDRAFCQSPVCGASRACFYTGRYLFSHGAVWNDIPLRVSEFTLGDYLRPLGLRVALAGKTHMRPDAEGMARLGLDPGSDLGVLISQCGFEPFDRDDGQINYGTTMPDLPYNRYLNRMGYAGDNPWGEYANSSVDENGEVVNGWFWRSAKYPARIANEHSETPYMTRRAMEFMENAGADPWCLHLSYIKPHWPYVAPAPYFGLHGANEILEPNRGEAERAQPHEVDAAFHAQPESLVFNDDDARLAVVSAYMGLVKQIDDELGKLFEFLESRGRMDDTMIVFTSDHGDYLGDHWMGEKQLFHEESVRIPMIVYDPDPAADATRGTVDTRLVESLDLIPTFIEAVGGRPPWHKLEGRSLLGPIRGAAPQWRDATFCETDYATLDPRLRLGIPADDARAYMVRTERWKYVLHERFASQLFDLEADPAEQHDLGQSADHAAIAAELHERLFHWLRHRRIRTTHTDEAFEEMTGNESKVAKGVIIGVW